MIKFETFKNTDHNGCSYCGATHGEMIQVTEDSHAGAGNHFIMSRKCARKFLAELKAFLTLHPSGV